MICKLFAMREMSNIKLDCSGQVWAVFPETDILFVAWTW
jgi:hypothetical protein